MRRKQHMRHTIGTAAAIVTLLVATTVPGFAQSPTPEASAATGSPGPSLAPFVCVPVATASAEPAPSASASEAPASTATVEPACEAGPDPAFVAAYTAVYDEYVADATPIVDAINRARTWAQHRRAWSRFDKVQAAYVQDMVALPWPEDFTELVGRWETVQRERGKLIDRMIRVRDNGTLRRLSRQEKALSARITPVTAELRARLGVE
jgi:hypothetical protein